MAQIKFLVFADLHYKKKMYPVKVEHLESIIDRAASSGADLVIHEGDFSNDYSGSPEITNAFLNNKYSLPVFGVYGNHELETKSNTMQKVTPLLTNRASFCTFGTKNGALNDGNIGYYYYDAENFRFIFLDTNYSLMPNSQAYEHNREASWGKPKENTLPDSLGPEQIDWLHNVLLDAAEHGLHCIINAHASFSDIWKSSPDAEKVRALYSMANNKRPGTVIMSLNGHLHTNHIEKRDGVLYFDVNVVTNGWWQNEEFHPYAEEDSDNPKYTYLFTDYDSNGKPTESYTFLYCKLKQGAKTLYFEDPLSAVVTVSSDGEISIEGSSTRWVYGISRELPSGSEPKISDYNTRIINKEI